MTFFHYLTIGFLLAAFPLLENAKPEWVSESSEIQVTQEGLSNRSALRGTPDNQEKGLHL